MADRQQGLSPSARVQRAALPGLTPMVGFLTLLISGGILLVLTGFTLTAAVIGLFFFAPLILLSSPIWVPAVALLFLAAAVVLCASGFGMVVLAAASSLYHYFSGRHPLGSDRLNYARSQVEDYACEYGGYFQSRIKDAAPGA